MANQEELELAKAGVEQLGETGREMVRLAADSSAASEAGGLLADGLRFQRFKRQLRIVKKAEELVDEAGLSARAVPLKTLAPLVAAREERGASRSPSLETEARRLEGTGRGHAGDGRQARHLGRSRRPRPRESGPPSAVRAEGRSR